MSESSNEEVQPRTGSSQPIASEPPKACDEQKTLSDQSPSGDYMASAVSKEGNGAGKLTIEEHPEDKDPDDAHNLTGEQTQSSECLSAVADSKITVTETQSMTTPGEACQTEAGGTETQPQRTEQREHDTRQQEEQTRAELATEDSLSPDKVTTGNKDEVKRQEKSSKEERVALPDDLTAAQIIFSAVSKENNITADTGVPQSDKQQHPSMTETSSQIREMNIHESSPQELTSAEIVFAAAAVEIGEEDIPDVPKLPEQPSLKSFYKPVEAGAPGDNEGLTSADLVVAAAAVAMHDEGGTMTDASPGPTSADLVVAAAAGGIEDLE